MVQRGYWGSIFAETGRHRVASIMALGIVH